MSCADIVSNSKHKSSGESSTTNTLGWLGQSCGNTKRGGLMGWDCAQAALLVPLGLEINSPRKHFSNLPEHLKTANQ